MNENVTFAGGRNIAMKVPPHLYEATIQFYRYIIGLKPIEHHSPSIGFEFRSNQLWIDRIQPRVDHSPGLQRHGVMATLTRRGQRRSFGRHWNEGNGVVSILLTIAFPQGLPSSDEARAKAPSA